MTVVRGTLTVFLSLSFSASLFGQTVTSSVLGTVSDPAGATVAGAEVQVANQSTGTASRATTDTAGLFRVVNILPGTYSVSVQVKRDLRT